MYGLSISVSMSKTIVITPIAKDLLSAAEFDEHFTTRILSNQHGGGVGVSFLTSLGTLFRASDEAVAYAECKD